MQSEALTISGNDLRTRNGKHLPTSTTKWKCARQNSFSIFKNYSRAQKKKEYCKGGSGRGETVWETVSRPERGAEAVGGEKCWEHFARPFELDST